MAVAQKTLLYQATNDLMDLQFAGIQRLALRILLLVQFKYLSNSPSQVITPFFRPNHITPPPPISATSPQKLRLHVLLACRNCACSAG